MSAKTLSFIEKSKNIFSDIILLYKNFFHWNISKCCIFAWSILMGIILSLPVFILVLVLFALDPIDWIDILGYIGASQAVSFEVLSQLLEYPFYVIGEAIIFGIACFMFLVGMTYGMVLETNLYLGYIRGKKIPYLSNYYFNRKIIKKYLSIFGIVCLRLLLPILAFLGTCIILYVLYYNNIMTLDILADISFWLFILAVIAFLYICYRVLFVFALFLDTKDISKSPPAKDIVTESFVITKGKVVFSFMIFILLYGLILLPYTLIGDSIESNGQDAKAYLGYKSGQISIQTSQAQADFDMLQDTFQGQSDNQVIQKIINLGRINIAYIFFGFLFVEGVFSMLIISFYLQFLSQKRKKIGVLGKLKSVFIKKDKPKTKKKPVTKKKPAKKASKKKEL